MDRYLREMFGVQGELTNHWLWLKGDSIWVAPSGVAPPKTVAVEAFGMLVSRRAPPRGQLSAPFIRRFCQGAVIRICDLDPAQAELYLSGQDVPGWTDEWPDGPRIALVEGHAVGRARRRGDVLSSELPKELRISPVGG